MAMGFVGGWVGDMVTQMIRTVFWALTKAALIITDNVYIITSKLAGMDIGLDKTVWQWFSSLSYFLALFAMIRLGALFFKIMFDEDAREKTRSEDIIFKIIPMCLALALLPYGTKMVSSMGSYAVNNISIFIGSEPDMVPSTILISTLIGETDNSGNPKNIELADIDINTEDEGKYKYFDDISEIFIMLLVACLALFGFIMNSIMIAKRFYSMGVKILISPIPVSGIIIPGDDSFKTWVRMMISDIISNFVQYLLLFLVLSISLSPVIRKTMGMWGTLIMFIAGILTVLSGVPEISRIIGGDTSTGGVLQQVAALRQSTAGVGGFVSGAVGGAVGAGLTAGAIGTVGVGKGFGGKKVADIVSSSLGGAGMSSTASTLSGASKGFSGNQTPRNNSNHEHSIPGATQSDFTRNTSNGSVNSKNEFNSDSGANYNNKMAYAKEGSLASKFAEYGVQNNGKRATLARMANNGGRHLYASSAKRVSTQKAWKGYDAVRNSAKKPQSSTPSNYDVFKQESREDN